MSTDPMTIRLAVETLLPITEGVDLRVPAADFPTWVDAVSGLTDYPMLKCQQRLEDGTWWAHVNVIVNGQHINIDADIDAPPSDAKFRETDNGIQFAIVTRDQLDYLTESA